MTWFQIYAFYVSPLLVLGAGLLVYWIAARDLDRPPPERPTPGE